MGRVGLAVTVAAMALVASPSSRSGWLEELHPPQASALRSATPGGNAWALIIGIDRYPTPTPDTIGSVADAHTLSSHLIEQGWLADHILLLINADATRDHVADAMRWLASKANEQATVILQYSGHERDNSLLLADKRSLSGREFSNLIQRIQSKRMWLNLVACNAGSLVAPHALRPGRLATFSSSAAQRSFGDAMNGHSIYGRYLIDAMTQSLGDANANRSVTVQEAFARAQPQVEAHTGGRQHPIMIDRTGGEFRLSPT